MKNLQNAIVFFFTLLTVATFASSNQGGNVSGIWTPSGSPYMITEDITVDTGDTLIIQPAVEVQFAEKKSLYVSGTLKALGTLESPVTFSAIDPAKPWGIILLQNDGSSMTELVHCRIQNASSLRDLWEWGAVSIHSGHARMTGCHIQNNQNNGIWCVFGENGPAKGSLELTHCIIGSNVEDGIYSSNPPGSVFLCRNNKIVKNGGNGMVLEYSEGVVSNNVMASNSGHGFRLHHAAPQLDFNTIAGNAKFGIQCEFNSLPRVSNSIIYGNQEGPIDLINSEIFIEYSNVQNYWDGRGNINMAPKFADAAQNDYHLLQSSPCIDGADPLADYTHEPEPNGLVANMGAYGNTVEAAASKPNAAEILVFKPRLFIGTGAGKDSASTRLTIQNLGQAPLSIDAVRLSTPYFDVNPYPRDIAPLDSIKLTVNFRPDGQGAFLDTLRIYSNDSNENPTRVPVQGMRGTYVSGTVSGVWTAENSPYIVHDIAEVPSGEKLVIEPGSIVKLVPHDLPQKGALFRVKGSLHAAGTEQDSIVFTRSEDHGYWSSILFENTTDKGIMAYCRISYGSGTQVGSFPSGAAVYAFGSCITVKNSTFTSNSDAIALRKAPGDARSLIAECTISDNENTGITNEHNRTRIHNNLVTHNATGIFTTASAEIHQNTIAQNETGLRCTGHAKPVVKNCIIWNNMTNIVDQNTSLSGKLAVHFSDVQGGWPGYGNIVLDPCFAGAGSDNYFLMSTSPCIDGGDPNSEYALEPVPNGNIANMGAFGNTPHAALSRESGPEILIAQPILDFDRLVTGTRDTLFVTVRNIGSGVLHINEMVLSNPVFQKMSNQAEIAPHDSMNVSISFAPVVDGAFSDTLWILNDDYTEKKSFVQLSGKATSGIFGEISGTWAEKKLYIISADVHIPETEVLTIRPGVHLKFMTDASLFVYGKLNCVGTENDSIVFTGYHEDQYWGGIYFGPESDDSQISYSVIKNGKACGKNIGSFYGAQAHLISCNRSNPVISHNTIRPMGTGGIYVQGADAEITDNVIIGGAFAGIRSVNSDSKVMRNMVTGNEHQGLDADNGGNPVLVNNISAGNGRGIYCSDTEVLIKNNTLFGNRESGIMCCGDIKMPVIKNNIIWQNKQPFYLYGGAERADIPITYNNIQGGFKGTGNIDSPPQFENAETLNFRLMENSPCIDAGDPQQQYNDIDGSRNDIGATGGPNGYYHPLISNSSKGGNRDVHPKTHSLSQNYPNPFNQNTQIEFQLAKAGHIRLIIYNTLGQKVKILADGPRQQGKYIEKWDRTDFSGRRVGSGIYFYHIQADKFQSTRKMLLIR